MSVISERRRVLLPDLSEVVVVVARDTASNSTIISTTVPSVGDESYLYLSFAEANALAEMLQNVLHPKTPPLPSPFGRRFEHNPTD